MAKTDIGWTRASIINLLNHNDYAVERALLAIYARQTADEQQTQGTTHLNARGFNKSDAKYGSYCARWVLAGNSLDGAHLGRCRAMVRKYHRQLREDANMRLAKALTAAFTVLAERAPQPAAPEMVQTNFGDLFGDADLEGGQ